jgi:predicted ABC-type ATPase
MTSAQAPRIYVLAGVNGAGKTSIGGAAFRAFGADYYNPDEAARELRAANPGLSQEEANSAAWHQGKRLLEQAIAKRLDFALETTLGASTIPRLLAEAAAQGVEIHMWYIGLESPELHIERVRARVRRGGHDIQEADIRRRYEHSRLNLIELLGKLAALRIYDNSADADPASGKAPMPRLVLHLEHGKIKAPVDLSRTPAWAKPIVAAALAVQPLPRQPAETTGSPRLRR